MAAPTDLICRRQGSGPVTDPAAKDLDQLPVIAAIRSTWTTCYPTGSASHGPGTSITAAWASVWCRRRRSKAAPAQLLTSLASAQLLPRNAIAPGGLQDHLVRAGPVGGQRRHGSALCHTVPKSPAVAAERVPILVEVEWRSPT